MHFDWWTLALQTVNFAVLVWLLNRFLYKPVLRTVDARRAEIDAHYATLAKADGETGARRAAVEGERAGIAAEREALLIEDARKTLAAEREAALGEARQVALDLGAELARRLLAELPAKQRAEAWLERVDQELAELPKSEQESLRASLAEAGAVVTVVTASPLPDGVAEIWRARLGQRLGGGITVAFAVDAALVAGAELHFPTAVLRASWRTAIAALRAEVEAHDDAR
jgi:F-type H+-transporting ATPase subunit b